MFHNIVYIHCLPDLSEMKLGDLSTLKLMFT